MSPMPYPVPTRSPIRPPVHPTCAPTGPHRAARTLARAAALAVLAALSSAGLAGCAGEPRRDPVFPEAGGRPLESTGPAGTAPTVTPAEPPRPTYRGPWEDPASPLFRRTVYFDYDSVVIEPEYIPVMRTHTDYLNANRGRRVTLEGHTDERGTREYNLALGDRRADAVRQFMLAEGVPPEQLATLSYGEERPAAGGHSDGAWRQNRRVVIQY